MGPLKPFGDRCTLYHFITACCQAHSCSGAPRMPQCKCNYSADGTAIVKWIDIKSWTVQLLYWGLPGTSRSCWGRRLGTPTTSWASGAVHQTTAGNPGAVTLLKVHEVPCELVFAPVQTYSCSLKIATAMVADIVCCSKAMLVSILTAFHNVCVAAHKGRASQGLVEALLEAILVREK